ncbi:MAG: radical SAM protein [Pelagibacterales bacterium]|nr:radical SAM protein [Pelagibacterales bacterium]|tara:strand:+ start:4762 stop:5682 length:921 start_codon:yes stop_codon:yes gene_type:complete
MKNNKKFSNKQYTISGEKRAYVNFNGLKTLWFNTGTLCNLSCKDCYIESSPKNDRLLYLSHEDVCKYLNEIETSNINCKSIGITGGEPFMNKDIIKIISTCLNKDRELLILTNAMQPLQNKKCMLLNFQENNNLKFRISLDHYTKEKHEKIRGKNSWDKTINGIIWLHNNNFNISIASRSLYENENLLRKGYKNLFEQLNLNLDVCNNNDLVLFPEMNNLTDTPEITTACWSLLGVNPNNLMCSNSRMIVKRKENNKTHVVACTLLPYTKEYDYGEDLNNSFKTTYLNHPHCSKFCVLGGANCINN